jgi:crossover junction endodeoxyribonuclease RuvC
MRFVGIDPGLRVTGYACVERPASGDRLALVEAGVIRLSAKQPVIARLLELHRELGTVLEELRPERVAVEEVFAHVAHVRTAIVMGHGRGVVLLAAAQRGLEIDEYSPAEVKKALTGRGQASKQQMQRAAMQQFGLRSLPEPPDVADAIAIAACAARRFGEPRDASSRSSAAPRGPRVPRG